MRGLMRDAARAVAARRQIVIFPEGTRAAPAPCCRCNPASRRWPRHRPGGHPGGDRLGPLLGRRAFRKYPGVIHIVLLPPIPSACGARSLLRR